MQCFSLITERDTKAKGILILVLDITVSQNYADPHKNLLAL